MPTAQSKYTLRSQLSLEGLTIFVKFSSGQQFQGLLDNINTVDINYCDSFDDVIKLVQDPNNVKIDIRNLKLEAYVKIVNTLKNSQKIIKIFQIPLKQIPSKSVIKKNINQLSNIIQICNRKRNLDGEQTKFIFQTFACLMRELLDDKQKKQKQKLEYEQNKQKQKQILFLQKIHQVEEKLREEFSNKLEKQLNQKAKQTKLILQKMNLLFQNDIKKAQNQNQNKIQKIQKQIINLTNKSKQNIQMYSYLGQKISQLKRQTKQMTYFVKNLSEIRKELNILKNMGDNWVHKQNVTTPEITIRQNLISNKSQNNIIRVYGPALQRKFRFSLKIIKINQRFRVGVSDQKYAVIRHDIYDKQHPNYIRYYNDSQLLHGITNVGKFGKGYKSGDIVTVCGDMDTGNLQFMVNFKIECEYKWEKLKDNSITWAPYTNFYPGDAFQIYTE